MQRESERIDDLAVSEMYRQAIERKQKLERGEKVEESKIGEVIGIDVPYEEPVNPELAIESDVVTPAEGAAMILRMLQKS